MADVNWEDLSPTAPAAANPHSIQPKSDDAAPNWDDLKTSEERFGTPLEMAKTAAEQGLSGLTLGASKVAETKLLGVNPQAIAGREEENPVTATTANIGGTGALLFGTGGLGELAEGAGVAGRLAAAGAEGGIISGANTATDDWSQNKPLDAQKIIANAGIGSLFGLAGGAVSEAVSGAAKGLKGLSDMISGKGSNVVLNTPLEQQNWGQRLRAAFKNEGNASDFIRDFKGNIGDIADAAEKSINSMYEEAGQFHLENALKEMPIQEAKGLADSTMSKIRSIISTAPQEGEAAVENTLSPAILNRVNEKLASLSEQVTKAETPLEVHNALSDFATKFDKEIKFDKLPTAAQQADQSLLNGVRDVIRGDLRSTDLWGNAGKEYGIMTDLAHDFYASRANFRSKFMERYKTSNGTQYRPADGKVKSFFKNIDDVNQANRNDDLNNFINSATKMANYGRNQEAFNEGLSKLATDAQRSIRQGSNENIQLLDKSRILNEIAQKGKGGHGSINDLLMVETMLHFVPGAAPIYYALKRYASSGGEYRAGADLYHTLKLGQNLADHAASFTNKMDKATKSIFIGSSQEKKE